MGRKNWTKTRLNYLLQGIEEGWSLDKIMAETDMDEFALRSKIIELKQNGTLEANEDDPDLNEKNEGIKGTKIGYFSSLDALPEEDGGIDIMEITNDTCRWPYGEPGAGNMRFCGAPPMNDHSFCHEHAKIAYINYDELELREEMNSRLKNVI